MARKRPLENQVYIAPYDKTRKPQKFEFVVDEKNSAQWLVTWSQTKKHITRLLGNQQYGAQIGPTRYLAPMAPFHAHAFERTRPRPLNAATPRSLQIISTCGRLKVIKNFLIGLTVLPWQRHEFGVRFRRSPPCSNSHNSHILWPIWTKF